MFISPQRTVPQFFSFDGDPLYAIIVHESIGRHCTSAGIGEMNTEFQPPASRIVEFEEQLIFLAHQERKKFLGIRMLFSSSGSRIGDNNDGRGRIILAFYSHLKTRLIQTHGLGYSQAESPTIYSTT